MVKDNIRPDRFRCNLSCESICTYRERLRIPYSATELSKRDGLILTSIKIIVGNLATNVIIENQIQ